MFDVLLPFGLLGAPLFVGLAGSEGELMPLVIGLKALWFVLSKDGGEIDVAGGASEGFEEVGV